MSGELAIKSKAVRHIISCLESPSPVEKLIRIAERISSLSYIERYMIIPTNSNTTTAFAGRFWRANNMKTSQATPIPAIAPREKRNNGIKLKTPAANQNALFFIPDISQPIKAIIKANMMA